MITCIVPAKMIPIDAALFLHNVDCQKNYLNGRKFTYEVRISPKNRMLSTV